MDGVFPLQFHIEHHDPLLSLFMPKHFRVAIATRDLLKDRVTGILGKAASVDAVGDCLDSRISGSGVNKHQWWLAILAEAAGIVPIDDGAAAEHRAHGIGQKFVAEFLPVERGLC